METLFDIPAAETFAVPKEPVSQYAYSLEHFNLLLKRLDIPLADALLHPKSAAFLATRQAVLEGRCALRVFVDEHTCDCENCRCEEVTIWWTCPVCGLENQEHEQLTEDFASKCRKYRTRSYDTGGCGAEFEARLVEGKPRLFLVHDPERATPNF